ASFSNYGAGIDIPAGQSILSTLNTGTTTPGSANVIAVAATTSRARASFSNYGAGIDIPAGQSILSTLNTGTTTPGSA
ncbi:hypothetical protein C7E18_23590, partial [Stenotrophomonas maltophilia]